MTRQTRETRPVPEEAVQLCVGGRIVAAWTASPVALEALAAGQLVARGFVRHQDDILALRVHSPGPASHRIEAALPGDRIETGIEEARHRRDHGCGLRHLLDCAPDALPPRDAAADVPDLEAFHGLFRELFDRSPSRQTTGGHHTTALCDGSRLLHVHEEVGRHNAADKAIGAALLAGDPRPRLGMITTARISGQIAEKAARAGLAWVASRSVPTTLAVEIASAARMPLIARAASTEARVFP